MPRIALTPSNAWTRPNPLWPSEADRRRIEDAQAAGGNLASRLKGRRHRDLRDCPIRIEFFRRRDASGDLPPMIRMLGGGGPGGGRGGEVRLKMYVSLLWASPAGTHDSDYAAADWAQLLGLPQYSTKGKRRVYDAIDWLDDNGFVTKAARQGRESAVTVRHESGHQQPYTVPSRGATRGGEPSYRKLQSAWWTNGWIAVLSGRALAMWIVISDRVSRDHPAGPVWIAESVTTDKYGISPHMRQRGMRELLAHGLITQEREFVREPFRVRTSRTSIGLNLERLLRPPSFRP